MLEGKNIVLGVTGGIAAYKAVEIVSRLKKLKADVRVIMTESAREFVTPLTFQSISQNYVVDNMFGDIPSWDVEHISLAQSADLFLVAPATANIIGKVANGIADDMLSTTIMATNSKVIFVPAMNTNMYNNPIFKENIDRLKSLEYDFIEAVSGRLACGDTGKGKMESPENIVKAVVSHFSKTDRLRGRKVIVTAGPTVEKIDPVRYISNNSSGKMGYSIAKSARDNGADVVLISGPTSLDSPSGVRTIGVETTEDMYKAVESEYGDYDILIKSAAPLDYRPILYSDQKIKKTGKNITIEFQNNVDIALEMGKKKLDSQVLIGFAAESENVLENARNKLQKKNMDFIIANDISDKDIGFKSEYNKASILYRDGRTEEIPRIKKTEMAGKIIENLIEYLECKAR